jgi:hypothetical protein
MGASMTGIIEWTHDAQCAARADTGLVSGPPRWHEDHLHGILFETDKEYDFFAAIAGARNRFGKPPLILPRGVPPNVSGPAGDHFHEYRPGLAGWLHLSEIDRCMNHVSDGTFATGFELDIALALMRLLVAKLTDPHVRLVFSISSP